MTSLTISTAPRLLPGAITLLLGGTLVCATLARLEHAGVTQSSPVPLSSIALNFTDTEDGGVAVHNATSGAQIAQIPARNDGFLRMVLRLLAAARARENISPASPFVLTALPGSHLQLSDPATGEHIELEAFGPSNVAEFSVLLDPKS